MGFSRSPDHSAQLRCPRRLCRGLACRRPRDLGGPLAGVSRGRERGLPDQAPVASWGGQAEVFLVLPVTDGGGGGVFPEECSFEMFGKRKCCASRHPDPADQVRPLQPPHTAAGSPLWRRRQPPPHRLSAGAQEPAVTVSWFLVWTAWQVQHRAHGGCGLECAAVPSTERQGLCVVWGRPASARAELGPPAVGLAVAAGEGPVRQRLRLRACTPVRCVLGEATPLIPVRPCAWGPCCSFLPCPERSLHQAVLVAPGRNWTVPPQREVSASRAQCSWRES